MSNSKRRLTLPLSFNSALKDFVTETKAEKRELDFADEGDHFDEFEFLAWG